MSITSSVDSLQKAFTNWSITYHVQSRKHRDAVDHLFRELLSCQGTFTPVLPSKNPRVYEMLQAKIEHAYDPDHLANIFLCLHRAICFDLKTEDEQLAFIARIMDEIDQQDRHDVNKGSTHRFYEALRVLDAGNILTKENFDSIAIHQYSHLVAYSILHLQKHNLLNEKTRHLVMKAGSSAESIGAAYVKVHTILDEESTLKVCEKNSCYTIASVIKRLHKLGVSISPSVLESLCSAIDIYQVEAALQKLQTKEYSTVCKEVIIKLCESENPCDLIPLI